MLTINTSKAIGKCWENGETKTSHQLSAYSIPCSNLFAGPLISINYTRSHCNLILYTFGSWKCSVQHYNLSRILNRGAVRRQLCHSCVSASSDEEYRSSRNIAISLFKRYRNVIDRGGGDNLKEFISAGVNAYALGCTDEGLKKELIDIKNSGVEIEGMEIYGGSTSLKSKLLSEEPTVIRWSSTPPITDEVRLRWKGFCALIANAYYVRGMAWLPVKTLQLEQMAVVGYAEEPSVVASRMRLVFSTLEVDDVTFSSKGSSATNEMAGNSFADEDQ